MGGMRGWRRGGRARRGGWGIETSSVAKSEIITPPSNKNGSSPTTSTAASLHANFLKDVEIAKALTKLGG
jgi:hypothetical protein